MAFKDSAKSELHNGGKKNSKDFPPIETCLASMESLTMPMVCCIFTYFILDSSHKSFFRVFSLMGWFCFGVKTGSGSCSFCWYAMWGVPEKGYWHYYKNEW